MSLLLTLRGSGLLGGHQSGFTAVAPLGLRTVITGYSKGYNKGYGNNPTSGTATCYATGSTIVSSGSGVWATLGNVTGIIDAAYGTWTTTTSSDTGTVDLIGYDFADIPAGSTISSVTVSVRHLVNNVSRLLASQSQLFDGGTGIGSISTLTLSTSATTDTYTPSPTLAQLQSATFKVRFFARKAANVQSAIVSLDSIGITVVWVAPLEPVPVLVARGGGY